MTENTANNQSIKQPLLDIDNSLHHSIPPPPQKKETISDLFERPFKEIGRLRKEYINKFGINFQLPSSTIETALVYPKDPTIMILFINYYPQDSHLQVKETKAWEKDEQKESEFLQKRISESIINERKNSDFMTAEAGRRLIRKSAIVFLQEEQQSYKIIFEEVFSEHISGHAQFSPNGELFAFSVDEMNFNIVDSSNFDRLACLKPIKIIQKNLFEPVQQIKFSQENTIFALIYNKAFDMNYIGEESEHKEIKYPVKFQEQYQQLLDIEFKRQQIFQGLAALILKPKGSHQSQVHLYSFEKEKITTRLQIFKIKDSFQKSSYLFRFSPQIDKGIITVMNADDSVINHKSQQSMQQTYILELENGRIDELTDNSPVRKICVLQNNEQSSLRPFICAASNNMDKQIELIFDEDKMQVLSFPFNSSNTQIINFDARIIPRTFELQVKILLLIDREKLCIFNYIESNQQGFDGVLQKIQRSSDQNQIDQNEVKLFYREFQEYQYSNFMYPYFAYNQLSQQINIISVDNSKKPLMIKMPQQRTLARVTQMKIVKKGQYLQFLIEDSSSILLYQFDILEETLLNKGEPLIRLQKNIFNETDMIFDFWAHTQEVTLFSKKLIKNERDYEINLYLLAYPSKTLYSVSLIQGLPSINEVSNDVIQVFSKRKQLFVISKGGQTIEQIDFFSFQNFQAKQVFEEVEGSFILQFINTNQERRMWILVGNQSNYTLKQVKMSKDNKFQKIIKTIQIKDRNLISNFIQSKYNGFIDESDQFQSLIFVANNQLFALDSILNHQQQKKALQFNDIFILEQDQSLMNNFPQVHILSQKIMNLIKPLKGPRIGFIMPTLISENKIRLKSEDPDSQNFEKIYSSIFSIQEQSNQIENPQLQHEIQVIFNYDLNLKKYEILDLKGIILQQGNFSQILNEQVHGQIWNISQNGKSFASYNQINNTVIVFQLSIMIDNSSISVDFAEKVKYLLPQKQKGFSNLKGKIENVIQKANVLVDTNHSQVQIFINNMNDILYISFNAQKQQKMFLLYLNDSQNQSYGIEIDYSSQIQPQKKIVGASLSDNCALMWTRNEIFAYKFRGQLSQNPYLQKLSLVLPPQELSSFLDVNQLSQDPNKFVIRISNSSESHMMVVWDENSKSEECSADVSFYSKILQDEHGSIFIMDNNQGLLNLSGKYGACKNTSFRFLLTQEQKDRARKILDSKQGLNTNISKSFHNKGLIGQKVENSKNQLNFILQQKQIILPYSYYQLIIKDQLEIIQLRGNSSGNEYLKEYKYILDNLPINILSYQVENQSILHKNANNHQELLLIINIFKEKDPNLLDLLMTKDQSGKMPLQLADQNPRCVNLLMESMAQGCSENFGKFTDLFAKDFTDLLAYSAFKLFLESAFFQSDQLRQITQLNINKNFNLEEKSIYVKHYTTVYDYSLQQNITDSTNMIEKNVHVNSLRADWILLEPEGEKFLQALSDCDDISIFQLKFVQTLVNFQWEFYQSQIIQRLFLPFIIYFFVFTGSLTILYLDPQPETWVDFLALGILLPFIFYFAKIEFLQLRNQGLIKYFSSIWNFIDILSVFTAFIVTMLMMWSDNNNDSVCVIGAFVVIAFYLKFFYFLRIFDKTAYFIRMIIQITYDIRYFIAILLIAMFGFGNGFYILSRNNEPDQQFVHSLLDSTLFVYRMVLGDFDVKNFGSKQLWATYLVFIICTLFIMIILLNLLIALMGDTYAAIKESQQQQTMKEKLQLILDNQFLVDHKLQYKDVKYIISITLDDDVQQSNMNQISTLQTQEIKQYIDLRFDQTNIVLSQIQKQLKGIEKKQENIKLSSRKTLKQIRDGNSYQAQQTQNNHEDQIKAQSFSDMDTLQVRSRVDIGRKQAITLRGSNNNQ